MNYLIMDQMKEYEAEFDSMLFHLPLSGSTFKKVYYDVPMARVVSKFVPADELVVPYTATHWMMQSQLYMLLKCLKMN